MHSDMSVTESEMHNAKQEVLSLGAPRSLVALEKTEPLLVAFIDDSMNDVWRLLDAYGVLPQIDDRLHPAILTISLAAVQALRHAHHRLWREEFTGTRLAQIDPTLSVE